MRKIKIVTILSLLMVLPFLTGCIKEDLDDCKGKVSLHFRYVGDGTTDIFPSKIEKVTLFVYTADGNHLVTQTEYDKDKLSSYQGADLELFPGKYHIVCWGNTFDATEIREDEKKIAAPGYFSGSDINTNDALYYGTIEMEVPGTLEHRDYTCDFVSSHIKIQVRLEGFADAVVPGTLQTETNMPVVLGMAHLPSFTDFGNVPAADVQSTYYPVLSVDSEDAGSYVAQYNVLRFAENNPVTLQILTGADHTVLQEFSIADFISKYGIQVEGRNEVTLSILLRASTVGVEIVDWEKENIDPGFDKN